MRDDYARAREGRLVAALSTIRDLEAGTHDPDRPTARTTGSSSPGTKPPAPIGPVSARREVLEVCASWALVVIDDRELDSRLVADTAGNVARWLLPHAEWLSQHEAAEAAAEELERAADSYRRIAQPTGRRHFAVDHPCPVVEAAGTCPGVLVAELQGHDDYDVSAIVCSVRRREHRWDPEQWARLGLLIRQDDPRVVLRARRLLDRVRVGSREVPVRGACPR